MKIRVDHRLTVSFFLFYFLYYFFGHHPFYSYDGLCYALDVDYGPRINLFHANHLFYAFTMRLLWLLTRGHGAAASHAIFTMQAVNAMAAAAAVALLYRVLAAPLGSRRASLAALLFGSGFALTTNATDPGCYALASFAAVVVLGLFLKAQKWPALRIGFVHGLAVLYHQLLILPALTFCLRLRKKILVAVYLLGLMSSCGVVYVLIGCCFHGPAAASVFYWLTHPADAATSPAGTHFVQTHIGSQFILSLRSLSESLAGSQSLLGLACLAALVAVSLNGDLPLELWSWPALLFCFQWVYFPSALTYRLLSWPALCALIAAGRVWKTMGAWILALSFAVFIFIHNAITIGHRRNPYVIDVQRAYWIAHVIGPRDYFVFAGRGAGSITNVVVAYFAHAVPARSLYGYLYAQPNGDMTTFNAQLMNVERAGGHIFVESDLRDAGVLNALEKERGTPLGTLAQTVRYWKPVAHLQGPDGYAIDQSVLDFHNE